MANNTDNVSIWWRHHVCLFSHLPNCPSIGNLVNKSTVLRHENWLNVNWISLAHATMAYSKWMDTLAGYYKHICLHCKFSLSSYHSWNSWNFRDRSAMTQETIRNILGVLAFNPLDTGFIFPFSGSLFVTSECGFMKFSGYWHKEQLAKLFHAWLYYFTLLNVGAVVVCAVVSFFNRWHWKLK